MRTHPIGATPSTVAELDGTQARQDPGTAELRFVQSGSRTVVQRAFATSPLRLLNPRAAGRAAWVYAATYGGGLVGGDEIHISVDVGPGARALLATQASTKVYRSTTQASQQIAGRVSDDGLLAVVPDPVVCFAGSAFSQVQRYHLESGGSLVALDWITSGRHAGGERWAFHRYSSRLELWRQGRRILYDGLLLDQQDGSVSDRMDRFNVYLLAVLAGPLVSTLAGQFVKTISSAPIERGSDLIISAACLRDDIALMRIAGVSVEQVAATLRGGLAFLIPLLGDDPWTRKW